jgi:capsular polysaccharide biosynthesis protein
MPSQRHRVVEVPPGQERGAFQENRSDGPLRRRGLKRFYVVRKNLKRLKRFLRVLVLDIHYLYLKLFCSSTIELRLLSTNDFVSKSGLDRFVIEPATTLEIPGPRFANVCPVRLSAVDTVHVVMPKIEVVDIPVATVMAGSNLVFSADAAIHPDLFQLSRDVIPAETNGIAIIDLANSSIRITSSYKRRGIERAISLLGQCSGNYAHWLTETLPKLLIINELPQFSGLPLIVDEWIHPVFLQTIALLDTQKRELILLERWRLLRVSSLVDISPTAYIPPALRGYEKGRALPHPEPDHYVFSRTALNRLREAGLTASRSKTSFGKKIYIQREKGSTGNSRYIENAEAIEAAILAHDFVPINPAKFSFEQQIAIFSQADCIVAPVGAALANAIFSSPGCHVIAMAAYYENADYYFFSNLMGVLGHRLNYVVGPQVQNTGHIMHRDYRIDVDALRLALEQAEVKLLH